MRILHIGKYYAPERGGIESQTQALCEWTAARGHTVAALVHQRPGIWRTTRETLTGVDVRRVACIAAPVYTPISPTFPIALSRALREIEPDLLHVHLPNPSAFALLASRAARRVPWIVHWHADIPPDARDWRLRAGYALYRPFEQSILKRASAIVATSQAYLDASIALASWRSKATVIPLGVDDIVLPEAQPDLWPSGTGLRLLAVGRLSHYKGFDVLIAALAQTPDARLLLIGDGEEAEALRRLAAAPSVAGRIRFAGATDDAMLQAAYATADALVLPSLDRGEAFGLVLLEAMRARVPVIASAIPGSGIGEVVVDGESGLLVPPGDADALAAAIRSIGDAALRRRLAIAGRERWENRFTLERAAQAWLALYADRRR
ncbi:MAG TPA: glycosyltransferase [Rhodanobacteraceae bacterium]|nr:glycosyltransferase [Rhodanobacteraceae bacterium]